MKTTDFSTDFHINRLLLICDTFVQRTSTNPLFVTMNTIILQVRIYQRTKIESLTSRYYTISMTRKKPIHMNIPRIFISLLYLHLLFIDLHYYLFIKHIIYIINLIFFTDLFQCMNTFSETIPSKNSLLRKRKCTQKQLQILTENAHIISLEVLQPRIFDHNTNSFGIRKTFDDRKNIQGGGIVSLPSAIK